MDGQLVAVIVVVALAALYVARAGWKAWRAEGGCASGCGKCAAPEPEDNGKRISLPRV